MDMDEGGGGGKAARFNDGKVRFSTIHPAMYTHLARVGHKGAEKYARHNYLKGGKPASEYLDSALRHLFSVMAGEWLDPETGCPHAAHVAWNMLFLCWARDDGLLSEEDYCPTRDMNNFKELLKIGDNKK
jgi:hypothetical protein